MLKKVGNPKAVQEALGHADLQTTPRDLGVKLRRNDLKVAHVAKQHAGHPDQLRLGSVRFRHPWHLGAEVVLVDETRQFVGGRLSRSTGCHHLTGRRFVPLPRVRNESVCCLYSATSSDDMSTVIMKPVVPLYSKALSPTFQVWISLGIILKPVLRAAPK